jgi:hypothetical protein
MTGKTPAVEPRLRLIIITGGPAAGKTGLARSLYGLLPRDWRLVPLDNFIGPVWKTMPETHWQPGSVLLGAECLNYNKSEGQKVLMEGLILKDDEVQLLCSFFGVDFPSDSVRLLQLVRSHDSATDRRKNAPEFRPDISGKLRDKIIESFRTLTPRPLKGAELIETDGLTEEEVLTSALLRLRA